MEALHELMSVLCDPEGKVCINGSPADLEIIQKSLAKLQAERDELRKEILQAKEAVELLTAGKPLGEVACKHLVENMADELQCLRAQVDADKARIAELEADYETMRGACGAAQNRILAVAQERDAAKAQLSACTAKHYGQMAEGAGKLGPDMPKPPCMECRYCSKGHVVCLSCSPAYYGGLRVWSGFAVREGFAERPQTQGL